MNKLNSYRFMFDYLSKTVDCPSVFFGYLCLKANLMINKNN